MTISFSHDHNVICALDTAGFCTWITSISTGQVWAFFRDAAGERVKISPGLVWFCGIAVPATPGHGNRSSTALPRRQDSKKGRSRALGLSEQAAAPPAPRNALARCAVCCPSCSLAAGKLRAQCSGGRKAFQPSPKHCWVFY